MFNIFQKKPRTLREHINYITQKPNMNFQLDFYRDHQVDFQMTRKSMLEKFGMEIKSNIGEIVFSLTFNSEKDNNENNRENFVNSSLYEGSEKMNLGGETFFVFCNNDSNSILNTIDKIRSEVYKSEYNSSASFNFTKF